jgi:hypothetical protein
MFILNNGLIFGKIGGWGMIVARRIPNQMGRIYMLNEFYSIHIICFIKCFVRINNARL